MFEGQQKAQMEGAKGVRGEWWGCLQRGSIRVGPLSYSRKVSWFYSEWMAGS